MFIFAIIALMILMMPVAAAIAIYIAQPDWFRAHKKSIIGAVISAVVFLVVVMLFLGLMPIAFL